MNTNINNKDYEEFSYPYIALFCFRIFPVDCNGNGILRYDWDDSISLSVYLPTELVQVDIINVNLYMAHFLIVFFKVIEHTPSKT